ncbi:hypothetical protein QUA43_29925 [Microcoleus sp. N9_B4]|uniref:hypothetical protein n=1 Tax=Microcoleus sp. N9_B4 TaxID=3055386 RepID=UPI002FD5B43C
MSSKKAETVNAAPAPAKITEPAEDDLLTEEEINEAVEGSALAIVSSEELEPIDTLDFEQEEDEDNGNLIANIGLTRSQLVEMNAAAETTVRLEEALKDHHREELQREKASAARKKLAALKSKPDAIAQLVKQITAAS